MADITARLIWYRLGEVAGNFRDYIADDDVDVLDILFGFWVLIALGILVLVYGLEWLSKSHLKPPELPHSSDQEKWSRLKRQNSFFTMEEHRPRPVWTEEEAAAVMTEEKTTRLASKPEPLEASASSTPHPNCQWLNRVILWMYLNYSRCPNWMNGWLHSLNTDLERRTRDEEIRPEVKELSQGSLPPKILSLMVEPDADTRSLFIRTRVSVAEFGFAVSLVKKRTGDSSRCNIIFRKFVGELRVVSEVGDNSEGVRVLVKFMDKPQMEVTATLPAEENQTADFEWVKQQVVGAFESSVTELTFHEPQLASMGDSRGVDAVLAEAVAKSDIQIRLSPPPPPPQGDTTPSVKKTEVMEETVVSSRTSRSHAQAPSSSGDRAIERSPSGRRKREDSEGKPSTIPRFYSGHRTFSHRATNSNGSVTRPLLFPESKSPVQRSASSSPMRSPVRELAKGQSIFTKVVKAAGLTPGHRGKERNISCVVELDEPYQRQVTHPVKGNNTAFWDQSFVLDLNSNSQRVTFTVFEGESSADGALGHTVVPVRELMAHPSSRQIIPLSDSGSRRRPRERDSSSGRSPMSVTVEFLMLRPESSPSLIHTTVSSQKSSPPVFNPPPPPRASSSSDSSEISDSSSSSEPATPTKPPSASNPEAMIISSNGTEAVVTSRELLNFMTPPETFQPLSALSSQPTNDKTSRVIESYQLVGQEENFQLKVQRSSLSSGLSEMSETPTAGTPSKETLERLKNDNKREERGRSEKPVKKVEAKRSRSFASRLRKTLSSASRNKERSQSADRLSASPQPPTQSDSSPRGSQSSLQKSKNLGLSGSFRRLFGGGRKEKRNAMNQRQAAKFGGGGPLSHSSPHLAPHPALLTASSRPRPPMRVLRPQLDENSSYSSEGYNISQDFRERSDSSV